MYAVASFIVVTAVILEHMFATVLTDVIVTTL